MAVATSNTTSGIVGGQADISAHGRFPSSARLGAALSGARRVRVIRGGMVCGEPVGREVLVDTDDSSSLQGLLYALRILDGAAGQCELCLGDPTIEISTQDRRRVSLGVHHGALIRWDEWLDDARLASPAALLAWLLAHGVSYVSREEPNRAEEREARARLRWRAATPNCLRPFAERNLLQEIATRPEGVLTALRAELPEPRAQALALFEWLGHGAGAWTAYPVYEQAAERLLLWLPFTALVDCLRSADLSAAQLEGAARFFAGWQFQSERRADATRLERGDTRRLLEHALRSRDPEKEQLARKAFS